MDITILEEIWDVWPFFVFLLGIIWQYWKLTKDIEELKDDHRDIKRMMNDFHNFAIKLQEQHSEHEKEQAVILAKLEELIRNKK